MGNFRLEINAVGGHGCARTTRDEPTDNAFLAAFGKTAIRRFFGCNNMYCPDCKFREFVRELKRLGVDVKSATETHWPGEPSEVVDDVLNQVRISGAF